MFEKMKEKEGSVLVILVLLYLSGMGTAHGDYEHTKFGKHVVSGFGHSVSIDGEYAIIGAPGSKCAYIYERTIDGWNEQDELSAPDEPNGFGASVAISGSLAVVGSVGWGSEDDIGKVWLFRRTTASGWEYDDHLINGGTSGSGLMEHPVTGERFGASIAIAADAKTIVVGAPEYESATGRVYIYSLVPGSSDPLDPTAIPMIWSCTGGLKASDSIPDDRFGSSVAVQGDAIFVGAPGYSGNRAGSGVVYVFYRDDTGTWQEKQQIMGQEGSAFGSSVCTDGWTLAVGAPEMSPHGQVYVYVYMLHWVSPPPAPLVGSWELGRVLDAWAVPSTGLRFGSSVSLDGDLLVVGAPTPAATNPGYPPFVGNGEAFLFEREPSNMFPASAEYEACTVMYPYGATKANDFGVSVSIDDGCALVGRSITDGILGQDEAIFYYDFTCDVTASISVSPSPDYNFGNVLKDGSSVKTFTISSSGNLDVTIDNVSSSNPHFKVKNAPTGENVPPDKTFDVEFLAGDIEGKHSGTITVTGISEFFPLTPVTLTVEGTTVEDEQP